MEGRLLPALDNQGVSFVALLGEKKGGLGVVDHHVPRVNRGNLRVKTLLGRASIHICEVAEL